MISYCKQITDFDPIPAEFIVSLDQIKSYKNCLPGFENKYESYAVNPELEQYIHNQFDNVIRVRYQVIYQDLEIHTDSSANHKKFNYLIDTGGDNVITRWWSDINQSRQLLHQLQCQVKTWYDLEVHIPHDVVGVQRPRISVVVAIT